MNNILIAGDIHIREKELEECTLVLKEIAELIKTHNIDQLILTGDTFDVVKPTSREIDVFANFIKEINISIIVLAAQSHESTTPEESIINHFGILVDKIKVVKMYTDEHNLLVGHFIVNESTKNYGGTISKTTLKAYKFVVLGHGHSHEIVKPNICQLGSVRYVDFAESKDIAKYVSVYLNYRSDKEKWGFIPLKTPYAMKDLIIAKNAQPTLGNKQIEAQNWQSVIEQLNAKTKLRIIFRDFESYYSNINDLQRFKDKFVLFSVKKDFLVEETILTSKVETHSMKDSLKNYLEQNKINEEIKRILLEEIK